MAKLKSSEQNTSKLPAILIMASIAIAVAVVVLGINFSSKGAVLSELELTKLQLIEENKILTNQLVNADSLHTVSAKAQDLSFTHPEKVLYIKSEDSLASAR